MQCFQKDPNLRVSARKLLRHAWIFGCRRADAQINAKTPANFSQAVEEVKQWNQALEDSKSSLRASTGSESGPPSRLAGGTPAKGSLALAKSKTGPGALTAPELSSMCTLVDPRRVVDPNRRADDDNWDDDFASAISPSALHLPHLKGHDNFGGLFSSEKLKAFAAVNDSRSFSESYDDDFEGELVTIKGSSHFLDNDSQEQTIRPFPRRVADKTVESTKFSHQRAKSSLGKIPSLNSGLTRPKSPPKNHLGGGKFELPARPDLAYREQSVEDYSDLFVDNDNVFDSRVNQAVKKVRLIVPISYGTMLTSYAK